MQFVFLVLTITIFAGWRWSWMRSGGMISLIIFRKFKWDDLDLSTFAQKHFNFTLDFFQLGLAASGNYHTFFEQLERSFKRQLAGFELLDDSFEGGKRLFKT